MTNKVWSSDIENMLDKLRLNCMLRTKYHRSSYFMLKARLKYFRIPVIVLSGLSSVFNVALNNLVPQETVSLLCCFISLFVGLVGSIEMYLQVQKQMEIHLNNAKGFHSIASDITKMLMLEPEHRSIDGNAFLDEIYNEYNGFIETSIITDAQLHDTLLDLDLVGNNFKQEQNIKILNNKLTVDNALQAPDQPKTSMLDIFKNSSASPSKNSDELV